MKLEEKVTPVKKEPPGAGIADVVNILIVDDNPQKITAIQTILDEPDYNIITTNSGANALRILLKENFAVIILDVNMPVMNGFETARCIRQRSESEHTPIIFVTAFSKADIDMMQGYNLGAVDYIIMPVVPEILKAKVKVFADLFRMNREIQKQAEELQRLNMMLENTNKELETFSYSVSHDLRAPLRSMDGFSQALLEDYADKLDEQGKDYLQRIRSASQHMAQLIDDMLNLSKVTRSEMKYEKVNLSEIANVIASDLRRIQPERKAVFTITDGVYASGDRQLLRIVLENLLGNAWKFTSHHPAAHIEFGRFQQADKIPVYFVRDDGAGFDMTYVNKLFGAFQRLHSAGEFGGTGIGLATVQRIINRHGGKIWAESKVEKGATFNFTI